MKPNVAPSEPNPAGVPLFHVRLDARRVFAVLAGVIAGLAGVHAALWATYGYDWPGVNFGLRMFSLNREMNIASFFSALQLLFAAGLLAAAAWTARKMRDPHVGYWAVLALGFFMMAIDETVMLHEIVGPALVERIGIRQGEGLFYYRWYWVYLPFVVVIAVTFVPFLRRLPRKSAVGMLSAGTLYLGGAIGMEMVESVVDSARGGESAPGLLPAVNLVEESLEMLGVALFIAVMLYYLGSLGFRAVVQVAAPEEATVT